MSRAGPAGTTSISAERKSSSSTSYCSLRMSRNICLTGSLGASLVVPIELDGTTAHDHVEDLGIDGVLGRLGHLLAREVDQQVGDGKDRVVRLVADIDVDGGTVLFADDAHECERGGYPVVALDAAVVVRVEVGHVAGLEGGILLKVQARRVHVGAQDVKALLERGGAQVDEPIRSLPWLAAYTLSPALSSRPSAITVSRSTYPASSAILMPVLTHRRSVLFSLKTAYSRGKAPRAPRLAVACTFSMLHGTLHDAGSFRIDRAG